MKRGGGGGGYGGGQGANFLLLAVVFLGGGSIFECLTEFKNSCIITKANNHTTLSTDILLDI